MPRVLVTAPMLIRQPGAYLDILRQSGFDVVYPPEGANLKDAAQLGGVLGGIDALLAHIEPYTREVIAQSNLRVIARSGVGYDAIDVAAATEAGIVVTITPGICSARRWMCSRWNRCPWTAASCSWTTSSSAATPAAGPNRASSIANSAETGRGSSVTVDHHNT
jgi:hypothetical protein